MIRINARGAVYGEIWYDEDPPGDPGVDILLYRLHAAPIPRVRTKPFLSLTVNLDFNADEIMGQFGKDCRYKIRRADTKDGLRMEFITEPASRLQEFCRFYDAFAQQKGVQPADTKWLAAACKAGQLVFTAAFQGEEALVWHAYLTCRKSAQLQYTGSHFRNMGNDHRALVGRANRWLHWQDMVRFKEIGMKRYDWGGLFEDESTPERAGINRFKKEFGGTQERTYDCTVPLTLRGRIYLPLREALDQLRGAYRRLSTGKARFDSKQPAF